MNIFHCNHYITCLCHSEIYHTKNGHLHRGKCTIVDCLNARMWNFKTKNRNLFSNWETKTLKKISRSTKGAEFYSCKIWHWINKYSTVYKWKENSSFQSIHFPRCNLSEGIAKVVVEKLKRISVSFIPYAESM